MSDLIERIRVAQREARERAAINGTSIQMASIMAGERVVIENLRRMEARAECEVVDLASRRGAGER